MAGTKRLYLSPYKTKEEKEARNKSSRNGLGLVETKESAKASCKEGVVSRQSLVGSPSGAGMDWPMAKDAGCRYWDRTLRILQDSVSHGSFLRGLGAHIGAEGAGMHVRLWVDMPSG
ncbi:hypothetical protein N7481_010490 [Penicillium waksmanii]|uniref:uncharacterized protein n=1 Tax=Penicillium waksmanii TaxID=69791 RepID=UPI0025489E38|nr:uncharacterized protein N7481_010490 [Penicillium waksmanii]KAJ5973280.1 hypothetical protein N7481_010490 [Penicillium waksmanii]